MATISPVDEQPHTCRRLLAVAPRGGIGVPQTERVPRRVPQVPLPRWGKLDHHSGWQQFADGVASADIAGAVAAFQPQVPQLCCVYGDGHSALYFILQGK